MVLKISVAAAVVVALLTAFLVVRTSDETAVRGTSMIITVWDAGDVLSRERAHDLIAATARKQDLTLYRSIDTVVDDRPTRTLSVINAGAENALPPPAAPYPDFGRSLKTRFLPSSSLDRSASPSGMYITSGSEAAADRFATSLNERGMDVTTKVFGAVPLVLFTAQTLPLIPLVIAILLGLLLGGVQSTVGHRRRDAIQLTAGAAPGRVVLAHVARAVVTTAVCGAACLLLSVPALVAYNGLAQFPRFALAAAVGVGAVMAAVSAVVLLTASVGVRGRLVPALNRKRPLRRLAALGLGVHTLVLTLVLVVLASVTALGEAVSENRRDSARWVAADEYVSLTFRLSDTEFSKALSGFARIGKEAVLTGTALNVTNPVGPTRGHGPTEGNSLIVNSRYLAEQGVLGHGGRRMTASDVRPDALTLLVPEDLLDERAEIVAEYREWIRFQAELDGASVAVNDVPIAVVATRSGQRLFNYSTTDLTSTQLNPVVAVLPGTTSLLSDDWIASEMTGGGVLFGDPEKLRADLQASGLNSSIGSINRVSDLAAVRLADQEKSLRASAFAGLLAAVIAVFAAVILAASIAERNRRVDFIRGVHGVVHCGTVILPTLVVALADGLVLGAASLAGLFPTTTAAQIVCGVVAADVIAFSIFLALQRRHLRAETVKNS